MSALIQVGWKKITWRHGRLKRQTKWLANPKLRYFFGLWKFGQVIQIPYPLIKHFQPPYLCLFCTSGVVRQTWRDRKGVRYYSDPVVWVVLLDDTGLPLKSPKPLL